VKDYESEFGTGTAWTEAELLLVNSRVRAVGYSEVQSASMADGGSSRTASDFRRTILEPHGDRVEARVYRGFSTEGAVYGPCLLEEPDTTIYVPSGASVETTSQGHFLIRLDSPAQPAHLQGDQS